MRPSGELTKAERWRAGVGVTAVAVVVLAGCGSKSTPASTVTVTQPGSASTVTAPMPTYPGSTSSVEAAPTTTPAAQITIPDLTGENAARAQSQLKALGLTNVDLASATEKYQNVFVPANWTVVSIEPAPGSTVAAGDPVIVKVTKP